MTKITPILVREIIATHRRSPQSLPDLAAICRRRGATPPAVRRIQAFLHAVDDAGVGLHSQYEVYRIFRVWLSQLVGWTAPVGSVEEPERCYSLLQRYVLVRLRFAEDVEMQAVVRSPPE